MGDEVEIHLEVLLTVRHRPGRESARGGVERHLPAMVEPGHSGKADLAYDLHPHVQCFVGIFPGFIRQRGPLGMLHSGLHRIGAGSYVGDESFEEFAERVVCFTVHDRSACVEHAACARYQ